AVVQALAGELLEEGVDLLRLRRDLPGLHDVPALVAERDGDLPCVLVDAQGQHRWFSCRVVGSKVSYFTLPTRGRTASSQRDRSFTDTKADWRKCGSCGGGADRRALRKRGEWRCARNSSASVLVLIRAPDLAATERRGGAGPVGGLLGGKDLTA